MLRIVLLLLLSALSLPVSAQDIPNHSLPVGKGSGVVGFGSVGPCVAGQPTWTSTGADPSCGGVAALNAKSSGATGDGATDDTVALQAWITACQLSTQYCYLDPSGTSCYRISSAINVTAAITIFGAGSGISRVCDVNGTQNVFNITSTLSNGTIRDIGIFPLVAKSAGAAILVNPGSVMGSWKFQNLRITGEFNGIVFAQNTSQSIVTNNTITCTNHCLEGSVFGTLEGTIFSNNIIAPSGNTSVGAFFLNADGLRFWGNQIQGDGSLGNVGVKLDFTAACTVCSEASIVGNGFSDVGTAVLYSGTAVGFASLIVDSNIIAATAAGVSVTGSGLQRLVVVGNAYATQAAGTGAGLSIAGATAVSNLTITGNVWDGSIGAGTAITVPAGITNCVVSGNSFKNWTTNISDAVGCSAIAGVTFAGLPAGVIGEIAAITDGKTASCGDGTCTTFGTTVTGGTGALKLLVWHNGTNWTLIGK